MNKTVRIFWKEKLVVLCKSEKMLVSHKKKKNGCVTLQDHQDSYFA
jgi:hypothetical protein